jgi:hypothetical protein
MSPEQAVGDRTIDARSDVYSMAAVLYEMLAGEPPITGASAQSLIAKLVTEAPTRLRVLRPTVPESIDETIAKALAKVPADRHATAGEFARALTTRVVSRRWWMPTVPWRPLAILGGIAAIVATGLVLARRSAPPSLPDRVQLTLTGNAIAPSLSPDGMRLAFAEKQCDAAGSCTYQLVIQDLDGTGRLVLTRDIGYIYKTQWTGDGRFVAFGGSHPPLRHGSFAVSTLGGATRFLGPGAFDLIAGDTSLLHNASGPPRDWPWVRRITVHDGQLVDSIPLGDTSAVYVVGLTVPDRLLVQQGARSGPDARLLLNDFRGRVVDRLAPTFAPLGRQYRPRWVPSKHRLLIAAQRELGGTAFDVLATKVTASAIGPRIDTVLSGVELGNGIFDVSQDGERLIYYSGPVETSVATIDLDQQSRRLVGATEVISATTRLRGRLSPTSDRLLLARDAPGGGVHASQFSMIPRTGGSEVQIPGTVEQLVDFEWSPGGARFMYLHGIGGNQVGLTERDTSGRDTREIARLERSAAWKMQPLANGGVALLPELRQSISIIRRPGKHDVTWHRPAWMSIVVDISPSPDSRSLAIVGISPTLDSVIVATLDIESGRYTKLESLAGSDPHSVKWLDDGSIATVLREPNGAWAFDRIRPGRPAERLGVQPRAEAEFSASADGARVVMFSYRDRNDVYMIRNFGRLLR